MSTEAIQSTDTLATPLRKGRRLEYITIGWNSLEAIAAIVTGVLAGGIALLGFGIDSVIETSSGVILLWRLREGDCGERRESVALRLVGLSFL